MSASNLVLVDTNVWLDYLLGFRQNHKPARDFVIGATELDIPLVIAPHSLKDLFYIFQQQMKRAIRAEGAAVTEDAALAVQKAAWAALDTVMQLATVDPSDQMAAQIAAKQRAVHPDYEDNLLIACAMLIEARMLVTSDEQLLRHAPMTALSPEDALKALSISA